MTPKETQIQFEAETFMHEQPDRDGYIPNETCYWCDKPISFDACILGDIGERDFRRFHTWCWGYKLQGKDKNHDNIDYMDVYAEPPRRK